MKIYVASSWRNEYQQGVVLALREAGFNDVYDFRNPEPGDTGFHWSEIDSNWKNWTTEEFEFALKHPIAEKGFSKDIEALNDSDVTVLVLPCGRSAHLELGYAVGSGQYTAVYNCGAPIEPELMYKMCSKIFHSFSDMMLWLKNIETKVEIERAVDL